MRSDREYEAKYGDRPDGIVSEAITTVPDEGKYLIKVPVKALKVENAEQGVSEHTVGIVATLFHGLFKKMMNPEKEIKAEDLDVFIQVDSKRFHDEWQAAVENSNGAFYSVSEEEVEDEITRFVPNVVVAGKGDESE